MIKNIIYCTKFYYFCSMKNILATLGNVPVTTSVVSSLYPNIIGKNQKIKNLEKKGEIIRLKRGLYVVSPEVSDTLVSTELIANQLYAPSYISMSSALRYYGLIPEAVYTTQSMTIKHSRNFETPVGFFDYTQMSRESFQIGLTYINNGSFSFVIALPEKALCDLVANSPNVNLRFLTDAEQYLEEDIRLDMDGFLNMNSLIFKQYIEVGKKSNSIKTILKYLEYERNLSKNALRV